LWLSQQRELELSDLAHKMSQTQKGKLTLTTLIPEKQSVSTNQLKMHLWALSFLFFRKDYLNRWFNDCVV
jgi:hypothetical protein